jgi:hypothetical protein
MLLFWNGRIVWQKGELPKWIDQVGRIQRFDLNHTMSVYSGRSSKCLRAWHNRFRGDKVIEWRNWGRVAGGPSFPRATTPEEQSRFAREL